MFYYSLKCPKQYIFSKLYYHVTMVRNRFKKNALIVNEEQENTNIITFLLRHLLLNSTQQIACFPTTLR